MADFYTEVERAVSAAFAAETGATDGVDPVVRPSDFADLQANAAMALARQVGTKPRELADRVAGRLAGSDLLARVEVAGPGFLNLELADDAIAAATVAQLGDERLGIESADGEETVVIDYSAPNVAKEMHAGHLRSTIIGDCLTLVHEALGHTVLRRNHIGDWGTPFGMLLAQVSEDPTDTAEEGMGDLTALYQAARIRFDAEPEFAERSRQWVVRLQSGDPEAHRIWSELVARSATYFQSAYDELGVSLGPGDIRGESHYQPALAEVEAELVDRGLLVDSDGALCAFPEGFENRDGEPLPLIFRKSDGGYTYGATDLAALRERSQVDHADEVLYVVGAPQAQHLAMVFAVGAAAGWLEHTRAEHVAFGSVLGADGKVLRTRAGGTVRLADLLAEGVNRARREVLERRDDLDQDEVDAISRAVGVGAIKFADLLNDRRSDYVLDFDRMMQVQGATGPYLQYAHARVASVLERVGEQPPTTSMTFTAAEERTLALALLRLPRAVAEVARSAEPHWLCRELLEVATAFSSFYENCPVARAEGEVMATRVGLCRLSEAVLSRGLALLGIESPERI